MRLLLIGAAVSLMACSSGDSGKSGNPGKRSLAADVFVVQPETLNEQISITGTIIPNEQVELKSEESGKLVKIAFNEGVKVQKGALLFQIDDRDFRAQAKNIQVQLELARKEKNRNDALYEAQAISQEVYEASVNKVAALEAEMDLLNVRIDRCQIRAPFSGRIGLRLVSEGAYISVGQSLVTLVQEDPLKMEFEVPEIYAGRIRNGMKLFAQTAGNEDSILASIYAYDARIDPGSRNLKVRALNTSNATHLVPGAFVKIHLALEEVDDAVMIPTQALVPELNGQKVYLVQNGKIKSRPVKTGIRLSDRIQITEGLTKGDTLMLTGILQAREGMDVQVKTGEK